ncbi:MAG: protein kinase [Bryobacteraceae bacterium]
MGGNGDPQSVPLKGLEHWQQVKELLNSALELDAEDRAAYLDKTCGSDSVLRNELQSLLASFDKADDFMESSCESRPELKPQDPIIGVCIGPYRVQEEIGQGGMGSVYRAVRVDDVFRKQVAIKIVRRGMNHEFILKRFRSERQILATLEHPNIARLLDGGATGDGLPYFVMEFVSGEQIDEYCDRKRLTTHQRLELFQMVCAGVQAAHDLRCPSRYQARKHPNQRARSAEVTGLRNRKNPRS